MRFMFAAAVAAMATLSAASEDVKRETVMVHVTETRTAVLVIPSGSEPLASVVLVDQLADTLQKHQQIELLPRSVEDGSSSDNSTATTAATSAPNSQAPSSASVASTSNAISSSAHESSSSTVSTSSDHITSTSSSSEQPSSTAVSTSSSQASSSDESSSQTVATVTEHGTTVTSFVVNTVTTSSATSTHSTDSSSSESVSTTSSSATSAASSAAASAATGSASPSSTENKSSSSGGLSTHDRNIVIGVVVGIGGALILAGLGYVAWRVWGRKGARSPAVGVENKSSLDANDPFRQNIDQYHTSAAPRVNNPAANF